MLTAHGQTTAVFAGLLIAKIVILMLFGPLTSPDTGGYVAFAKIISSDAAWLSQVDFSNTFAPVTTYRMAGYPFVLAGAQQLSADGWMWLVAGIQAVFGAATAAYLFHTLLRISRNVWLSLALAFAFATSINAAFDLFILTDSLFVSFITAATCAIIEISLDRKASLWRLILIAISFTACFLLREASTLLCLLWLPLLAIALLRALPAPAAALAAILVYAPLFLLSFAYVQWNEARTGERFITTSYQGVLLQPLVKAYKYDPSIFSGATDVDDAARRLVKTYTYDDCIEINRALHKDHGWTGLAMAREFEARYWRAWGENTWAMVRAIFDRLRSSHAFLFVSPISTWNFAGAFSEPPAHPLSYSRMMRDVREGRFSSVPLLLIDIASKAAALALLGFAVLSVLRALSNPSGAIRSPLLPEMIALGAAAAGFFAAHAIVHLEDRYLMPIVPLVFLICAIAYRERQAALNVA